MGVEPSTAGGRPCFVRRSPGSGRKPVQLLPAGNGVEVDVHHLGPGCVGKGATPGENERERGAAGGSPSQASNQIIEMPVGHLRHEGKSHVPLVLRRPPKTPLRLLPRGQELGKVC